MESSLRFRLVFKDPEILRESQIAEGLKRAWILVNQSLETISELSDHLVNVFELRDSCPNGLVLSMGGFVLPPFESTSMLNERDVVRVNRKCGRTETTRLEGVAVEQTVNADMKLLANEEFGNESGGYRSDSEEAEPEKLVVIEGTPKKTHNKKRKAAKKLNRSSGQKKRKRCESTEEASGAPKDVQKETKPERNGCSNQHVLRVENGDSPDTSGEVENSIDSDVDEKEKNVNTSTPDEKRSGQIQENVKSNGVSTPVSNGSKSVPSRSTRRKRVRRQYLREKRHLDKEKQVQIDIPKNPQPSEKATGKSVIEHQQADECSDVEGAIFPVVVRPGHIRFEPLSKDDSAQKIQTCETPPSPFFKSLDQEIVKWNGTMNKKKGQKWGREKTTSYKWSDQESLNQEESIAAIPVIEEVVNINAPIELEKLTPCTSPPQVGHTVAYRFIELSSSWNPEISSFRVGKVSKFDPGSDSITLVQVPEYPIEFENNDKADESAAKSNMYGDDGSLQIEYSSLIDVRMVKPDKKSAAKSGSCIISRASAGDQGASSSSWPSWPDSNNQAISKKPSTTVAKENGKVNAWDAICDTLRAKKAELSKGEDWTKRASSYRGLRGSGIGPIMARLRAQNEL